MHRSSYSHYAVLSGSLNHLLSCCRMICHPSTWHNTMKDLGKTIAKYRKEHKLNQSQFAKELENYDIYVKQNSISAWELGTAIPNARQFLALCEILEIYDIYTEFVGQSPLNPFRNLNENGMNKVLDYISDLESTGNYKPAEIIPIHVIRERKVFYNTVSAGTGSFLDGDEYEIFSSPDIPEDATFGVYVDGDSMEPKYHNKDLIWIEQTACLDDGEIGIFYLDGNAYVKKFQNNRLGTYLISLNKKYDPIPVTENSSFKIFGRVLS